MCSQEATQVVGIINVYNAAKISSVDLQLGVIYNRHCSEPGDGDGVVVADTQRIRSQGEGADKKIRVCQTAVGECRMLRGGKGGQDEGCNCSKKLHDGPVAWKMDEESEEHDLHRLITFPARPIWYTNANSVYFVDSSDRVMCGVDVPVDHLTLLCHRSKLLAIPMFVIWLPSH